MRGRDDWPSCELAQPEALWQQNTNSMAKSKSFFGLRRGSTKSHTYQVFRGEQITKDRVYEVSNPQTTAQMEQRLKLPMIAQAASILKEIINHSFEGVEYGEESIKRFRQINLKTANLVVSQYVPKGMINTGIANFAISTGSLVSPGVNGIENDGGLAKITLKSTPTLSQTANTALTQDDIKNLGTAMYGNQVPDQVTFILSYNGNTYSFKNAAGETKTEGYQRFVISRLIFDENRYDENAAWKFTDGGDITNGYILIMIDGTKMQINLSENVTSGETGMAAAISSKLENGTWKRSNERFVPCTTDAITYDDVINTYVSSSAATSSTKYLNAGDETVTITGGSN